MIGGVVGDLITNMKDAVCQGMSEFFANAFHNFINWIVSFLIKNSYPLCLTAFVIAIILYIGGYKKSGKYASLSLVVYFILQAIAPCFMIG